jgi:hypothetical protein
VNSGAGFPSSTTTLSLPRGEQPPRLHRDHELLARLHDLDAELPEEADAVDDPLADVVRMLPIPPVKTSTSTPPQAAAIAATAAETRWTKTPTASGENPIVVSTERPSRTAVTERPPPRWQTTSRSARTCDAAHCTEMPWNP